MAERLAQWLDECCSAGKEAGALRGNIDVAEDGRDELLWQRRRLKEAIKHDREQADRLIKNLKLLEERNREGKKMAAAKKVWSNDDESYNDDEKTGNDDEKIGEFARNQATTSFSSGSGSTPSTTRNSSPAFFLPRLSVAAGVAGSGSVTHHEQTFTCPSSNLLLGHPTVRKLRGRDPNGRNM
jgi:hypothetical protein